MDLVSDVLLIIGHHKCFKLSANDILLLRMHSNTCFDRQLAASKATTLSLFKAAQASEMASLSQCWIQSIQRCIEHVATVHSYFTMEEKSCARLYGLARRHY